MYPVYLFSIKMMEIKIKLIIQMIDFDTQVSYVVVSLLTAN